ncbi:MAG TPA: DUF4395 family protein [Gemmatimonadales bacterium]|nr:DUF4395 family protein [Gemmatimonadales bacterium]
MTAAAQVTPAPPRAAPLPPTTRRRLAMQGVKGLDAPEAPAFAPWFRFAPALCAAWTAVGTALRSPALLWALVPVAALGAARTRHPFETLVYDRLLRPWLRTPALPPYGTPRRIACATAAVWLTGNGLAFHRGRPRLGTGLGLGLVAAALVPATTDFCIPSFVYGLVTGFPAGGCPWEPASEPASSRTAAGVSRPAPPGAVI